VRFIVLSKPSGVTGGDQRRDPQFRLADLPMAKRDTERAAICAGDRLGDFRDYCVAVIPPST
jgi:hypothetical protein